MCGQCRRPRRLLRSRGSGCRVYVSVVMSLTLGYVQKTNWRALPIVSNRLAVSELGLRRGSARSHLGTILPAKDWKMILPSLMT